MDQNTNRKQNRTTFAWGLILMALLLAMLPVQVFAGGRIDGDFIIQETAEENEPHKAGSSFSYITPSVTALYNNKNGIDVRFQRVSGATRYVLYRYDVSNDITKYITLYNSNLKLYNGNYIFIDRLDGYNRWNELFGYYIVAYNSSGERTYYSSMVGIQRLAPVEIKVCRPESSFEITVQWRSVQGSDDIEGYQIQYAKTQSDLEKMNTRGTFHYKNQTGKNNISCTLSGLSSNTKYYFRVRAYSYIWVNRVRKTVWSEYSPIRHTVTKQKQTRYTKYRAVLIGNSNYYYQQKLEGCANDVNGMSGMLKKFDYTVKTYKNLTKASMVNAIQNGFGGATSSDISLFYYSGHGVKSGALVGIDDGLLTLRELANMLSKVPGRVVIMMDSCYSGQGIRKGESSEDEDLDSFNQKVIDAFAAADPGLSITDPDVPGVGYGELRTNKFYVLTAAAYNELSWEGYVSGSSVRGSFFTRGIIDGTGYTFQLLNYSGKSPADTNNDKKFTLRELFYYAHSYVKKQEPTQNVQWYPMGAVFTILVKN